MSEEEKREKKRRDVEELQEVLKAVSEGIPALIKGIVGSVFSGESGANMGKAVANFYKELKAAGMPDDVAIRMTENYVKTFTDIGSVIKEAVSQKGGFKIEKKLGEEIKKSVEEEAKKAPSEEKTEQQ